MYELNFNFAGRIVAIKFGATSTPVIHVSADVVRFTTFVLHSNFKMIS